MEVLNTIKFADLLKVLGGIIVATLYFVSPLSERVLVWVYGENIPVEYHLSRALDLDLPFRPTATLTPSKDRGLSAGVLEWQFFETSDGTQNPLDTQVEQFDPFTSKKVVTAPEHIDLSNRAQGTEVLVVLIVRTRFSELGSFERSFALDRDSGRPGVSINNFTGIWHVQFGDTPGVKILAVTEGKGRAYSACFQVPKEVLGVGTLTILGRRDGLKLWIDEASGSGTFGMSDLTTELDIARVNVLVTLQGKVSFCSNCSADDEELLWTGEIFAFAQELETR